MSTTLSPSVAAVSTHVLLRGAVPAQGTLNTQVGFISSQGEAAYAALLTAITAGQSNDTLARTVVTNAGLVGRPDVVQYVADLFGVFGAAARGQVVLNLAERLLGLGGDAAFGAYATAFNSKVAQGVASPLPDPVSLATQAATFSTVNAGVGALSTSTTPYVNTIAAGPYWGSSAISYSFNTSLPSEYAAYSSSYTLGWQTLNEAERAIVRQDMATLSQLTNLKITEVATNGDIRFNAITTPTGEAGFAFRPGSRGIDGDVFISVAARSNAGYYDAGGYGRLVIAHEIGHALGLKHSFESPNVLPTALDDLAHTVMTYTTSVRDIYYSFSVSADRTLKGAVNYAYPGTYALLDVEALQSVYGANLGTATGDNIYTVDTAHGGSLTIWDAGGVDTIDASAATSRSVVDLREGTTSSINLKTTAQLIDEAVASLVAQGAPQSSADSYIRAFLTRAEVEPRLYTGAGNLQIVQGSVIENLRTGSGNDEVWDNAVNNVISTGAGDDLIHLGAGGYDIVDGGAGTDTVQLAVAHAQVQRELQAGGNWLMVGDGFAAQLIGVERIQFSDGVITLA